MSERDDDLLHIVSAWQEMSWPSFRSAFDSLHARLGRAGDPGVEAGSRLRWRALRLLDWLGHCDVPGRHGANRIFAAPAVLARLPVTGFPEAILCGTRSPRTSVVLEDACRRHRCWLAIDRQSDGGGGYVPRRFAVGAESDEAIGRVAQETRASYLRIPPALGLLQFSGSVDEYIQSRTEVKAADLDWPRRDFDPNILQFRARGALPEEVRLSLYEHPLRPERFYYLWRGGSYREVDRDWGGYALLAHAGVHVLAYDPRRFILVVPSGAPLPRLLARACTLCSGHAPRFVRRASCPLVSPEHVGFHVFREVPPAAARIVAEKLRQRLDTVTLATLPME